MNDFVFHETRVHRTISVPKFIFCTQSNGLVDKLLTLSHSFFQSIALSQIGGYGRGERGARAVHIVCVYMLFAERSDLASPGVVEQIHEHITLHHALHNHTASPSAQFLHILQNVGDGMTQQHFCLKTVWGDECGHREEFLLVGRDAFVAHKLHPITIHNHWVNHLVSVGILFQHSCHTVDDVCCGKYTCLDALCTHIVEKRLGLAHHQLHRQRSDALHALCVFVHNASQRTCRITATCCNGLDVGLHACTAQWFTASDEEDDVQLLLCHLIDKFGCKGSEKILYYKYNNV